ncbi:MAG: hypothetical protein RhofKO_19940 [Rhodothermales bacterium]
MDDEVAGGDGVQAMTPTTAAMLKRSARGIDMAMECEGADLNLRHRSLTCQVYKRGSTGSLSRARTPKTH